MSDCILWIGATIKTKSGERYGYPSENGKHYLAHRAAWESAHNQKIPKGYVVRHMCDVTLCVNPDHLRIGTQSQNMMDSVKHGRHGNSRVSAISCRSGHLRTPENTYVIHRKDKGMERICRVCKREDARKYRLRIAQRKAQ